ncbi:hypothetical protein MD484_g5736, partial [Candolleomyces efflorescens]
MYNPAAAADRAVEEESGTTGRLGRFSRRFEELGSNFDDVQWMEDAAAASAPPASSKKEKEKPAKQQKAK